MIKIEKLMIRLKSVTVFIETGNGEKELKQYPIDELFNPEDFAKVAAETNEKYSKMHPGCQLRLTMRDETIETPFINVDDE